MQQQIRVHLWVAAACLVIAVVAGGVSGWLTGRLHSSVVPVFVGGTLAAAPDASFAAGFWPVLQNVVPAVVNISSSRSVKSPEAGPQAPFLPFFYPGDEYSPRSGVPRHRREQSLGSGVIVSPTGTVITNNHVVEGATEIKVYLPDKREFKAKLVGTDPNTDVAVLKIDARDLPVVALGDSNGVHVGDFALAIGNPFGIGQTVTMGIVSATGRSGLDIEQYEDFIQTDAAINPGNSGGALIDVRGRLIGINTAILAEGEGGGNQGVGFAVPVNMVRAVMDQIQKNGKVVRGWLGVGIQEVSQAMAQAFGMKKAEGVVLTEVDPSGPAAKSGLAVGDIITQLDGQPIIDGNRFRLKVASLPPGTAAKLRVIRNGNERILPVTLGELPTKPEKAAEVMEPTAAPAGKLGIAVDQLTADLAHRLGLPPATKGVVVLDVDPDGPAADAGLRRGDIIQEVNRKPVTSVAELQKALSEAGNRALLLRVNRRGSNIFVPIEPQ